MSRIFQLRVTSSILAVTKTTHNNFIRIPTGALIETSDDLAEPGLRHVTLDDKELLVYTRDIRERTQYIETAGQKAR